MNQPETSGYFHRVAEQTPTVLWVNNPTPAQAQTALEAGAMGISTNPTYPSKLPVDYLNKLIDTARESLDDDEQIGEAVYQESVRRLLPIYQPLYEQTQGRHGQVAIQTNPRTNTDPDSIIESALRFYEMGQNVIVEVPATPAGAQAMEELTAMDRPTIATLCFLVDQAVYMAEAYRRGLQRATTRPVCYVTFISGILEDYLKKQNEQIGNAVPLEVIQQAGCAVHRVVNRIFQQRGYEAILLGGGARGLHHFTDLIGGDHTITIGWAMIEQLLQEDPPVVSRIDEPTPAEVIATFDQHLADFGRSYREHSLSPQEFCDFPLVKMFQQSFIDGVDKVCKVLGERKKSTGRLTRS